MFIPLRHDSMEGRRWPVISIALVVLNLVAFLGTHWQLETESPKQNEVRSHIILLAARHPELNTSPDVQQMVTEFQQKHPGLWNEARSETRDVADAWEARIDLMDEEAQWQAEMDSLTQQFSSAHEASLLETYAFVPAHPTTVSYLTANFLHGGWLHLIGNMWFLWLAGVILEDTWGRLIYPLFYLLSGAAALQFHAWFNPGSLTPTLGASGAVAALMGAFLVRYPTTKIEVAVVLGLRSLTNLAMGKGIRFKAAAYWLLPLWLLMEIFSGALFGSYSGVAHWAHVGGFAFGGLVALGLRYSGLESQADQAIEAKVSWTADSAIVQATESMEHGKLDEALSSLKNYVATKPDSVEAYTLIQQVYWRKNDIPAYRESMTKLCQAHLKVQDVDAAWHDYEEFKRSGDSPLPASTWLELCRAAEGQENFDRAISEYEQLALAYPKERQSLLALMAAGRLSLKKVNRPSDAVRFYQLAAQSPVPHLDWDSNIQNGLQEAQKAIAAGEVPALKS